MNKTDLMLFLVRAGVQLDPQQWTLIDQQLEIDRLTKEIEQWGRKTNIVTFEE